MKQSTIWGICVYLVGDCCFFFTFFLGIQVDHQINRLVGKNKSCNFSRDS